MKRKSKITERIVTDAKTKRLQQLCEELGEDTLKELEKVIKAFAAAVMKRARQQAEEQLQGVEK